MHQLLLSHHHGKARAKHQGAIWQQASFCFFFFSGGRFFLLTPRSFYLRLVFVAYGNLVWSFYLELKNRFGRFLLTVPPSGNRVWSFLLTVPPYGTSIVSKKDASFLPLSLTLSNVRQLWHPEYPEMKAEVVVVDLFTFLVVGSSTMSHA